MTLQLCAYLKFDITSNIQWELLETFSVEKNDCSCTYNTNYMFTSINYCWDILIGHEPIRPKSAWYG